MFRRSAVDALRDMLDAYGELLPLEDVHLARGFFRALR